MIAPDLTEEFPPGDAVGAPTSDEAAATVAADAPVADPPVELDETARLLAVERAQSAELVAENAALVARVAQLEAQKEERWMPLKTAAGACRPPQHKEHVRRLAAAGEVKARRRLRPGNKRGLWDVEVNSIEEYQARRFAK